MTARKPSGGVGSNQYATRGVPQSPRRTRDIDAEVVAAAFGEGGLRSWQAWNADAAEIAAWHNEFTGLQTALWLCHRDTLTVDEALAGLAAASPYRSREQAKLPPSRWNRWSPTGIAPAAISDWTAVLDTFGGADVEVAGLWHAAGHSPRSALAAMKLFPTPADQAYWTERGGVPARNAAFTAAAVDPNQDAYPGKVPEGMFPDALRDWSDTWRVRKWGLTDPDHIRQWRNVVYGTADVDGVAVFPEDAGPLQQQGIPPEWACAAVLTLRETDPRSGHPSHEFLSAAYAFDPHDPQRAAKTLGGVWRSRFPGDINDGWVGWCADGFSANEADEWDQAEIHNSDAARFWKDRGLTARAAHPWHKSVRESDVNEEVWGRALADLVRRRGGTPQQAAQLLADVSHYITE